MKKRKTRISYLCLGGGRQSTALFLMLCHGDSRLADWADNHGVPWPRMAIFADPGREHPDTYAHLWRLAEYGREFNVELWATFRTDAQGRRKDLLDEMEHAARFSSIPAFTWNGKRVGMLERNCTRDYKVQPIHALVREQLGRKSMKGAEAHVLLGISADEPDRIKPDTLQWERRHYPLAHLGLTTADCVEYNTERGFTDVPKSACVICPFRGPDEWAKLKLEGGPVWEEVKRFDASIRDMGGRGGIRDSLYLTKESARLQLPIDETPLAAVPNNGWSNDCGGICGV